MGRGRLLCQIAGDDVAEILVQHLLELRRRGVGLVVAPEGTINIFETGEKGLYPIPLLQFFFPLRIGGVDIRSALLALWELPGYKLFLKTESCRS